LLQQLINEKGLNISVENFSHPLYTRFVKSFKLNFQDRSNLEIAILLRQILLHETSNRGDTQSSILYIPNEINWPDVATLRKVGLICNHQEDKISITSDWWNPSWLNIENNKGIDYLSTSEFNDRKDLYFDSKFSDIFLESFENIKFYKSNDQQRAVRSTLSLKNGETLLINLPTGEGKSLIFHLINQIGFSDKTDGLTIIIVPTVSLALDHEKYLQHQFKTDEPFAYIGGRESENLLLKESIKISNKNICILSPEAACGAFRNLLILSASNGNIKSIIIDEAHIVEEWGNDFRYDFQIFAGLWRQLLNFGEDIKKFRTILLSATYTQNAVDTLKILFTYNHFKIFSAAKLRPEIDFWFANKTDEKERVSRVIESLIKTPKPTILYTTKVEKANEYYNLLKEIGFKSIEVITGDTSSEKRDEVVIKWKNSSLDIVVATSSFGLGINYEHTRSVIHACIPESLNRYYQEVGRGGRDGKSSLALLIPSYEDEKIAKRMSKPKILKDYKIHFNRWERMFLTKRYEENTSSYLIDLDTIPDHGLNFDDGGKENRRWNIQVLLFMIKSGILQFNGISNDIDNFDKFISIRILDENHLNYGYWCEKIEKIRMKIFNSADESLSSLFKLIENKDCPSDLISKIYNLSIDNIDYAVSKICSHCSICRINEKKYFNSPIKRKYPNLDNINYVEELFLSKSLLIEYELVDNEFKNIRMFERKFINIINTFVKNNIQNFIYVMDSDKYFMSEKIKRTFETMPMFIEKTYNLNLTTSINNLPYGTTVIFLPPNLRLDLNILKFLKKENLIIFIEKFTKDPSREIGDFINIYPHESLQLKEFIERIA
jgi:superfamily II DNA/RNA helicase